MGETLVGLARSFVSSCTGYFWTPAWRTEADRLMGLIKQSRDEAAQAAKDAQGLLGARALEMNGGMTTLRGAIATANIQAKAAKRASGEAAANQKLLCKLLKDNSQPEGAVGDIASVVTAAEQADTAAGEALRSLQAAAVPSSAWHATAARLNGGILARLNVLKATPSAGDTGPLFEAHQKLGELLKSAATTRFNASGVTGIVDKATVRIDQLELAISNVETKIGGGPDQLDKLRKAAVRQFRVVTDGYGLSDVMSTLLDRLRETDPKIKPQHLVAITRRQDAAPARLEAALNPAADPQAIDAALNEALRSYRESVASLATNVNNGSALEGAADKANAALEVDAQASAYEDQLAEVQDALADLRVAGGTTTAALRETLQDIIASTSKTGDYQKAAATSLPALLKTINKDYTIHKTTTEPKIEALGEEVEKLRTALARARKDPSAKSATALLATIQANIDEAANFIDCNGNIEAAEPAIAIISEVRAMLDNFQLASSSFATLAKTLEEIKTGLAQANLKLIPVADLASLNQRLADLQNPANGLSAAEFKTSVAALKTDLADQTGFANDLKNWREAAVNTLRDQQSAYELYANSVAKAPPSSFGGTRPDPSKGVIKAALDAMATLKDATVGAAGFDAHKTEWTVALQRATDGLALVWDGSAKTLKSPGEASKDSEAGTQRAEDARLTTEAWKQLDKKAKSYSGPIKKAKGNDGEYQLLLRQLATMPDQISKDPATAKLMLADIEKRLETIRGTPDFDQVIAREIGKIPAQWQKVLELTAAGLTKLVQTVEAASATTEFEASMGAFGTLVDGAKARFEANAFNTIAGDLAKPDPSGAKRDTRRAQREEGVRLVRQYQAYLFNDPLFKHLQENPFGIGLFGPLFRFLDRAELEFLRLAI